MTDTPIPPLGQGTYPFWWNPGYVPSIQEWQNLWSQKIDYNQAESVISEKVEKLDMMPLTGGTATGALYVDGHFVDDNGCTLSQPNGNAIGNNQFYTQLAQDKSGNLYGQLTLKKNDTLSHVLECTPDGTLTNINGKSLALTDDITAETARAQAAEANTVRTHTTNVDAPTDLVTFNKGGQSLAVHRQDTGEWKYFNTTDNSIFPASSDTDVKIKTLRTATKKYNGRNALVADHDGYDSVWYASEDYVRDLVNNSGGEIKVNDPGSHSRSKLHHYSFQVTGINSGFNGRITFPTPIQGAGKDGSELAKNPNNVQIFFTPAINIGIAGISVKNKVINNVLIPDVTNNDFGFFSLAYGEAVPICVFFLIYYWGD